MRLVRSDFLSTVSTDTGLSDPMDKELPDGHLLDVKFEIKRCQDGLAELSHVIHEIEDERNRVSRTILHQDQSLTHLSGTLWMILFPEMVRHQLSRAVHCLGTTTKLSLNTINS